MAEEPERRTPAAAPARVLIVDEHPIVRMGVAALLSTQADLAVCGEAANGEQAVSRYLALRPDLTLMGLRLHGIDGVTAIQRIRAMDPVACIIVLTGFSTEADLERALRAGVRGYVLKAAEPDELLAAIRHARRGARWISDAATVQLVNLVGQVQLTSRELAVLQLLACGRSNREIGETLAITVPTVKVHVTHLFEKLNVGSRTEAMAAALQRGLVRP